MTTLRPITSDRETALALARRAIRARNESEAERSQFLSGMERDVADGSAEGVLRFDGDRVVGIALWDPRSPVGLTVEVIFSVEGLQNADEYRAFFAEIEGAAGPVALAPGQLAGLTDPEEDAVMRRLGFARFARSEMRFPPETPTPEAESVRSERLRTTRPGDLPALMRLHELAYRDHLDRYLFLLDSDPRRDSDAQMRGIVDGRWGEFLPWASPVIEGADGLAAAALVVRASYGPLVAHVMVDPSLQGRGLGRAVVTASIRALRERGESVIVLNVTDGNTRATQLYERLGFVRTIGPSHGWYSTERIPVAPDPR